MTDRRLREQSRALLSHVTDASGTLEPKMVIAVAKALARSRITNRARILRSFRREIARLESRQRAVVMSAVPPTDSLRNDIGKMIRGRHPEVVEIEWQTDSTVIGGVFARVGDTEYDFSVADKLQQVQEHLG